MTVRRWPAEWEPQSAVWLSWPHNMETWPNRFQRVPASFAAFARTVAQVVPVRVLVAPAATAVAREHLGGAPSVELIECPTNDCWIRDFGPTFVVEGTDLVGVDWRYNAWGGKYPPWDDDAAAAAKICQSSDAVHEPSRLCCEGGALETDGRGRLLTTPGCLITDSRNPGWSQEQIAQELHKRLGVTEILWIDGGGLEGDDTDGHVDQLARFVNERNVVCAVCDDPRDANHEPLESNYRQLRVWGRETDPPIEVHRLPIPAARRIDGARVPESYCNFLIAGASRVIMPTFHQPDRDVAAAELLARLMPDFEVVALDASDLVWGLGAFHCASQHQPALSSSAALATSGK